MHAGQTWEQPPHTALLHEPFSPGQRPSGPNAHDAPLSAQASRTENLEVFDVVEAAERPDLAARECDGAGLAALPRDRVRSSPSRGSAARPSVFGGEYGGGGSGGSVDGSTPGALLPAVPCPPGASLGDPPGE